MLIDKKQLSGKEPDIEALKQQLSELSGAQPENGAPTLNGLLGEEPIAWDSIKAVFRHDFRAFDQLLFKLHFKRNAKLSRSQRERVITFLSIGYLHVADVRYFNEFLYFYREGETDKRYALLMLQLFFNNLNPENRHPFLLAGPAEIESFFKNTHRQVEQIRNRPLTSSFRIGLLGSPTFFKKIRAHFLSKGFDIRTYFIPFHPDRKINFLLNNRLAFWLMRLATGATFRFSRLDFHYKDPKITEVLKAEKLDIGFHKLGFIIKKNIIDPFRIGIINDHWAVLPYIRGRSTIEYSLLFGIPVAATAHIVEEGVDSGDIISIYRYDQDKFPYSTIKEARNQVRKHREKRAIDAIELLSRAKKPIIANLPEKGLMFYSMHPDLVRFVDQVIL